MSAPRPIRADDATRQALKRTVNAASTEEQLREYLMVQTKHRYSVFMSKQGRITAKHQDRCREYLSPIYQGMVERGLLKRANVVCDHRVNDATVLADNDLVCFIVYETRSGSVFSLTMCMNPVHARTDALQASKQMPGIRRI